MSPRDYKNAGTKSKRKTRPTGSWVSFVSGLGIGLLVALAAYMWCCELPAGREPGAAEIEDTATSSTNFEEQMARTLPKREFDFYKILPEMEVKVPDWEITKSDTKQKDEFNAGTYVLQVGSFKAHKDADRAKAQLALRGIKAKIHRVVINGQDVWYRVHVGPYSDLGQIQKMRVKLNESDHDFIVLKIGENAG